MPQDRGFLSLLHLDRQELCEAGEHFRETGQPPKNFTGGESLLRPDSDVLCSAQSHFARFCLANRPRDVAGKIKSLLNCDKFTEWTQGHSPKEHMAMQFLERQQAWLQKQSER